ncbi:hypothetical protein GF314_14410 [bacterium]|nr:hypothetical protein [bacterium]
MRMILLASLVGLASMAAALDLQPTADLRVRQEVLDGVYHFAPETDRDWVRVRTRLGLQATGDRHALALRLANEHRHYLTPDQDLDWDEVLIDRLAWRIALGEGTDVTLGRQDIIWPGGFLVLEGHPLDGSRTIFHDGVRLRHHLGEAGSDGPRIDVAAVHNRRQAGLVLIDDQDRALTFGDETGLLARVDHDRWSHAFILKHEDWPDDEPGVPRGDLTTWTFASRHVGAVHASVDLEAELALQYQHGDVRETIPYPDDAPFGNGWALAGQAFATVPFERASIDLGGFFYSGARGDLRPFKAPWGNWPKWSELYIYTLLGESTPGRPHVAAWENVAAPRVQIRRPLAGGLDGRVGATWLTAPAPEWASRGLLLEARLDAQLRPRLRAHLLFEWLDPGSFHDGRYGLAPLTDPVSFLRWEISWSF